MPITLEVWQLSPLQWLHLESENILESWDKSVSNHRVKRKALCLTVIFKGKGRKILLEGIAQSTLQRRIKAECDKKPYSKLNQPLQGSQRLRKDSRPI